MYGLIVKMTAQPGQSEALAEAMLGDVDSIPGCLSFVVARDGANPDILWISEAWVSQEAHRASLSLQSVVSSIARARPMIAAMEMVAETAPIGGLGMPRGA